MDLALLQVTTAYILTDLVSCPARVHSAEHYNTTLLTVTYIARARYPPSSCIVHEEYRSSSYYPET